MARYYDTNSRGQFKNHQAGVALFEVLLTKLILGIFVLGFLQTQSIAIKSAENNKRQALSEMLAFQLASTVHQHSNIDSLSVSMTDASLSISHACSSSCQILALETTLSHIQKSLTLEMEEFNFSFFYNGSELNVNFFWKSTPLLSDELGSCAEGYDGLNHCFKFAWQLGNE